VAATKFDLERTIWDPDYRRRVIAMLKNAESNSNEAPTGDRTKIAASAGKSGAD